MPDDFFGSVLIRVYFNEKVANCQNFAKCKRNTYPCLPKLIIIWAYKTYIKKEPCLQVHVMYISVHSFFFNQWFFLLK